MSSRTRPRALRLATIWVAVVAAGLGAATFIVVAGTATTLRGIAGGLQAQPEVQPVPAAGDDDDGWAGAVPPVPIATPGTVRRGLPNSGAS